MKEIFSSLTILGMGIYGLLLHLNNKLGLYIHPRFFEESLAASLVAIVIGVVCLVYFTYKTKPDFSKVKTLLNKKVGLIILLIALSFLFNTLFLLVALFVVFAPNKRLDNVFSIDLFGYSLVVILISIALFVPAKSLSSITASQRSIDLNSINLTQNTISAVQNFNKSTSNYSLGDWLAMIGFNPDPQFYKDKEVKISGFIYKPSSIDLDANTVLVARFIVTCCAVDARPVGLKVRINNLGDFKVDDWVEVEGKFNIDSNNELIVESANIKVIDAPSNPYIF